MIRITQQREKCIGCNACVEMAFHRWRISKRDGKSVLIGGEKKRNIYQLVTGDDELEDNLKAAGNCPVKIIKVDKIASLCSQ